MGASSSTPKPPTLDDLDGDEQRVLLRNIQLLNQRNTTHPGKFTFVDFREVHAAMPPRLAAALWRGLSATEDEAIGLDSVIRTIVPLRTTGAAAFSARQAYLKLCFPGPASSSTSSGAAARAGEHPSLAVSVAIEEAAPWLAAIGRPWNPGYPMGHHGSELSAAAYQLLVEAALACWLVDLRELEPLPVLTEGTTRLLTSSDHIRFLSRALPTHQKRKWRLLFTTARDGVSFTRFLGLTTKRAPCLLVIRDKAGATFGGFASEPLVVSPQFGGGYGSFLFTLAPSQTLHKASGDSPNLVYLNAGMEQLPNGLAFGGNLDARFFGLWLKDDLETGRSDAPCSAYSNAPCLSSSSSFEVDEIELWAVEDDPPPPSEEELAAQQGENALTAAGVLSSKHQETRNFLAMAGKETNADKLGIKQESGNKEEPVSLW